MSSIGDAREYLIGWVGALASCKQFAYVLAHSFDLPVAVDALIAARRRGVVVWVLLDKAQATSGSSSHNLRVIAQRRTALGVRVRLYKSRRLRATALLTDLELLLGSASWTVESQSSVEQGATLRLFDAARREQESLFKELWKEAAKDWNAGSEPSRGASRPSSAPASSP